MAGQGVTLYTATAGGNKVAFASGIDWRENVYLPNQINDNVAQIMADLRALVNQIGTGWVEVGDTDGTYTPTYVAANQFRIDGADVSAYYRVGMRVRAVAPTPGTISGTITAVAYSTPNTTVTVFWDSGSLANETITAIMIGIGSGPGGGASGSANPPTRTSCYLSVISSGILRLQRHNTGHLLTIDNQLQVIPVAGVDVAPVAGTAFYYIYAYMNAGVMALEMSGTSPGNTPDPRNGIYGKAGDYTRTYVGAVWNSAGTFIPVSNQNCLCSSAYNKQRITLTANLPVSPSTAASTPTYLHANTIFNILGNVGHAFLMCSGYASNNTVGLACFSGIQADFSGGGSVPIGVSSAFSSPQLNYASAYAVGGGFNFNNIGYYVVGLMGWVSAGCTGTWAVGNLTADIWA